MIVAECECGEDVPFVIEERSKGAVDQTCECGRTYQLKVRKTYDPEWKSGVKRDG